MATQSSILAWEIPWTEEPGGLQSMGWQRVGRDLVTKEQEQQLWVHISSTYRTAASHPDMGVASLCSPRS